MFGILLALTVPAFDGDRANAGPEELVRQLSDEKFDTRQQAHDLLAKLGMDAFGALNQGLAATDPEVARRCRELLDQLRVADLESRLAKFKAGKGSLPGYERYLTIAGSGKEARDFFIDMWSSNPIFMAEVEERPDRSAGMVVGTAQNIVQNMYNRPRGGPARPALAEVAALLFAMQNSAIRDGKQPGGQPVHLDSAAGQITNLMNHEVVKAAVMASKNGEPSPMYKLTVGFVRSQMRSPQTHNMLIHMCMNLNLKESVELAEVVLANRGVNHHGRGLACALIGKFGSIKDAPLLAAMLDDNTHINQFQLGQRGQMRGTTEVRDVALAQLVSLTRQSHKDYGFPFAEQGSQFNHFNTYNMGFTANDKRRSAMTKWKTYAASRPELQPKQPLKEDPEETGKSTPGEDN